MRIIICMIYEKKYSGSNVKVPYFLLQFLRKLFFFEFRNCSQFKFLPQYFNFLLNRLNFCFGNYSREVTIQGPNYMRKYGMYFPGELIVIIRKLFQKIFHLIVASLKQLCRTALDASWWPGISSLLSDTQQDILFMNLIQILSKRLMCVL